MWSVYCKHFISIYLDQVTACVYRKPLQQVITAAKDGLILLWEPKDSGDVIEDRDSLNSGELV